MDFGFCSGAGLAAVTDLVGKRKREGAVAGGSCGSRLPDLVFAVAGKERFWGSGRPGWVREGARGVDLS